MENTVVFNWPSGASGDFIISCANILDGKTVNFIETTKCFIYQRTKDLSKLESNNHQLLEHIYKNI